MGFLKGVRNVKNHANALWIGEVRCDQCGRYIKNIDSNGIPLIGEVAAIAGRIHATATKHFCCAACEYNYMQEHPEYERKPSLGEKAKNAAVEYLADATADMRNQVKEEAAQMGNEMKEQLAPTVNQVKEQLGEMFGQMKDQMKGSLGGLFGKKK